MGFALADAAGVTIATCGRYAQILGLPAGETVGVPIAAVTHPDDIRVDRWLLDQDWEAGGGFAVRKRYVRADGSFQWVEDRVIPLGEGHPAAYLIACCPIVDPRPVELKIEPSADLAAYIAEVANELALMAKGAGLDDAAHLLNFASLAAARDV